MCVIPSIFIGLSTTLPLLFDICSVFHTLAKPASQVGLIFVVEANPF